MFYFGVNPLGASQETSVAHNGTIEESIGLATLELTSINTHCTLQETAELGDYLSTVRNSPRLITETIAHSESNHSQTHSAVAYSENLDVTASNLATKGTARTVFESFTKIDSHNSIAVSNAVQSESIALSSIESDNSIVVNYLGLHDSFPVGSNLQVIVAETLTIAAVNVSKFAFLGSISEQATVVDEVLGINVSGHEQSEDIVLFDSFDAIFDSKAVINELLSIQDYPRYFRHEFEQFIDSFALRDSFECVHFPMRSYYLWQSVISQYANSPALIGILEDWSESIDQAVNIDRFYDFVWNVETAQGYGLDVWGRIVNISRTLQLNQTLTGERFGFTVQSGTQDWKEFNQAPFFSGFDQTSSHNYLLGDAEYRRLIMAKAFSNIMRATIQNYNALLRYLFPDRGNCYVIDNMDMTMTLVFDFILEPFEQAMLEQSGVLKLPTGVGFISTIVAAKKLKFQEAGPPLQNLNSTTATNTDAGYFNK